MRRSLGEGGKGGKLDLVFVGIVTVLGLASGALLVFAAPLEIELPSVVAENAWPIGLVSVFVPPALAIMSVTFLFGRGRVTREAQWIAALPFPFAHEGYVEALRRAPPRIELVVRLARPAERAALEASWEAAGVPGTLFWRNPTTASISSPEFATHVEGFSSGSGMSSAMSSTTGGPIHAWFRRLVATGLAELQRDYGLSAVELKG